MHPISSPIEDIRDSYQVVIVGSGYGGAIAASRLARAGQEICLLERGREWLPGEYPNTQPEFLSELQLDTENGHIGSRTGLYDMRINSGINVFQGCGLGGTSLVNANVSIQADPRVFEDPAWPKALRDDVGDRVNDGRKRALEMLGAKPYPEEFPKLAKLEALEQSSRLTGGRFYRPSINVTFEDGPNQVGVEQKACVNCGDCMTGCNHSAKNTLLMNYLPDAWNHGATIFTRVGVRHIEKKGSKWLVHYQLLESGREQFNSPTMVVKADMVILGAGALGSTEILLRSGIAGLPLSEHLGQGFTGNGDFLGYSYNSDQAVNGVGHGHRKPKGREPVGPCITGIIDKRATDKLEDGMVIEEGSVAGALGAFLPLGLSAGAAIFGKDTDPGIVDALEEKRRELESILGGPYQGAVRNTQTYLVMAHDDAGGKMKLQKDRLRISWPGVGKQKIFKKVSDTLHDATRPLGGTYLKNPTWSPITDHNITTVHPLGGCCMGADGASGVVNHKGQVFSSSSGKSVYKSLYVTDGSVIPRPLGVNPLLTISAVTERCCALMGDDRGWAIDYTLPRAAAAPPRLPPANQKLGVRFTETMKGFFSPKVKDDFGEGERRGKAEGSSFQFILTIITDDLREMIKGHEHRARIVGVVIAPKLSRKPLTVTEGVFNLLMDDPDDPDARLMKYRMKLSSEEGKTFYFYGFKTVKNDPGPDLWADTTTLYITVYKGDSIEAPVLGRGVLVIKPQDFMVQMTTMQVTNAKNDRERLKALADFGNLFNRELFEVYGGVLAKKTGFARVKPRVKRPLRMSAPELHLFNTEDGVTLKLTRYKGGDKGPVILSPGFGTNSLAFAIDTIETNCPEFLFANGYDVWLFDYRASPDLQSASTQFSLDDIATKDYPAAVDEVLKVTGAKDVQILAHCVGSMTFLMSMLAGKLKGKVRSAICSQLAFYPTSPPINEFRAGLRIASFLTMLGVETMTTDVDADKWEDQLADALLKGFPTKGRFKSPVERRIQLMYGEVYKHDNLNPETHAAMHEMFGVANLTTFSHLGKLVRKRKILNAKGKNVYLPHLERLAIPITFIHGVENHLFLREGTLETLRALSKRNDATLYSHITFPKYAHMDFFIGENAAIDIFPTLAAHLDRFNQPRAAGASA